MQVKLNAKIIIQNHMIVWKIKSTVMSLFLHPIQLKKIT
jgi:hypothetical protein